MPRGRMQGSLIRGSPKSHSVVWWVVGLNMMLWAYTSPAGEMGGVPRCQPRWLCIVAGGPNVDKQAQGTSSSTKGKKVRGGRTNKQKGRQGGENGRGEIQKLCILPVSLGRTYNP